MSTKITLKESVGLVQNYIQDKQPVLSRFIQNNYQIKQSESTLGTIRLKELKQFIEHLETHAEKAGLNTSDIGLDLYFGSYEPNGSSNNKGQLTTLFVPCLNQPNSNFIFKSNMGNIEPLYLKDITSLNVKDEIPSVLNRLGMIPPPDPTKSDIEQLFNILTD